MSTKLIYACSNCDAQYPKWVGRCSECGKFGTVSTEPKTVASKSTNKQSGSVAAKVQSLSAGEPIIAVKKQATNLLEVDRVLGGGLAQGSLILLTGEPGVGKSTLVMSLADYYQQNVLYVSGEESFDQIKSRLKRLRLSGQKISFTPETNISSIAEAVRQNEPSFVIVDSLQTMYSADATGQAGSPNQSKAVLAELAGLAKDTNVAILIIGHVTKEGIAAGPKTIEHLVDVVLSLDGEKHQGLRFLRALKNRFGPTDEVGVFKMADTGLEEVSNPSNLFLSERHYGAGSCVVALLEGSRSLLVEVQALVTRAVKYNHPKRATSGFDANRLQVLLAVLGERAGVKMGFSDVYINLAGGYKSKEPALDLAVVMAAASASIKKILPKDLVIFGEIGLGGEVRPVVGMEKRLQEAARLGFKQALVPVMSSDQKRPKNMELVEIRNVSEAVEWLR